MGTSVSPCLGGAARQAVDLCCQITPRAARRERGERQHEAAQRFDLLGVPWCGGAS